MPVVALGEDRHAVHVRFPHGPREGLRVEVASHVPDPGAGVEIQMDLAVWQGQSLPHGISLFNVVITRERTFFKRTSWPSHPSAPPSHTRSLYGAVLSTFTKRQSLVVGCPEHGLTDVTARATLERQMRSTFIFIRQGFQAPAPADRDRNMSGSERGCQPCLPPSRALPT